MGETFGLLAVAAATAVGALIFWATSRERGRWWRLAADAAGLANVRMPVFFGIATSLTGTAGALGVKIRRYHRGKYEHGTRIEIGGLRHGAYGLSIRHEGMAASIEKAFGEREIEVGDPEFDAAAYLQGSPGLVRAIFDAETRRLLRPLLNGTLRVEGRAGSKTIERLRVSVSDDQLRVEIRSSPFGDTDRWLPDILAQLVDIGNRLRRPDDPAGRIAANIREEPLEAVRLANLRTLTSEFAAHAATRGALREALRDGNPAVRLHVAAALGPEGLEALLELTGPRSPDDVAARAIGALGPAFPPDRAAARLEEARKAGQAATALACIEVLGAAGGARAIDSLRETLASAEEATAAAAAHALGRIGSAAAEPALLAALDHASGAVRVAAAESLGRLGTPLAVVPLRDAASSHLLDGELRRAARQAVAQIQSRVSGASPGQLSLAGDQSGQLSLAEEDRRGQVSMAQAARAARAAQPGQIR